MRLIFVHWVYEDRGSAQDLYNYREAAQQLGHEVVIYGAPKLSSFRYSLEIGAADGIIFIVEWTTALQRGDQLDWLRLAARVPRARRVVIDCDGKYNDAISVVGDHNHPDAASSRAWIEICDSLSDKIYQPTRHPLRSNVGTFFFHAYNPAWAVPLDFSEKSFGMIYVGNNWFRWGQLQRILRVVEQVRPEVGRIGITGQGWDKSPAWANSSISEDAYHSDPDYLKRLASIRSSPAWAAAFSPRCCTGRCSSICGSSRAAPSRRPRQTLFRCSGWIRSSWKKPMGARRAPWLCRKTVRKSSSVTWFGIRTITRRSSRRCVASLPRDIPTPFGCRNWCE